MTESDLFRFLLISRMQGRSAKLVWYRVLEEKYFIIFKMFSVKTRSGQTFYIPKGYF